MNETRQSIITYFATSAARLFFPGYRRDKSSVHYFYFEPDVNKDCELGLDWFTLPGGSIGYKMGYSAMLDALVIVDSGVRV